MRILRAISLSLVLVLAFAPSSVRSAAEPITVPVIIALTGPFALLGNTQKQALDVFEKTVNESGGIRNRPLQFAYTDDAGNAATSVQIMNQLIARKAQLVIGPSSVATCRAVAPLVANGPVEFCMSAGGATPKGGYSFTASYSTADAVRVAVHYFREKGWRRIAILEPTDATGQDGENSLDLALALPENKVMTVVAREHYNDADISVAAQLARIKAANPDVLYTWATGSPIATVLHALVDAGYNLPMFASHGNMLYASMAQFGDLTPKAGLYFAGPQFVAQEFLPRGPSRAAVDTFVKAFTSVGARPDVALSSEWDLGLVIADTLRHVGPDATAEQIRDYIEGIHGLAGATAVFDFRDGSQRGITAATILMARWDQPTHTFVAVSSPGGTPLPR